MIKSIYIVLFSLLSVIAVGQTTSTPPTAAQEVAQKIAKKMKDSLSLNDTQENQVKDKNLELFTKKQQVRMQYATNDSLLRVQTQKVERTRDSLYKPILTTPQYDLYLQKKKNLISNN